MPRPAGCLALAALLVIAPASPPGLAVNAATGAWLVFDGAGRFGGERAVAERGGAGRFGYRLEIQARYPDAGSGFAQYVLRPSLVLHVDRSLSLALGYGRFETRLPSGERAHEDRPWQQAAWRAARWSFGDLVLRGRLEQRLVDAGDRAALTLRCMLRMNLALPAVAPDWRFAVSVEPFLDLRDTAWGIADGITQSRWYLGASYPLPGRTRLAVGYLAQQLRATGRADRVNHLLQMSLNSRF